MAKGANDISPSMFSDCTPEQVIKMAEKYFSDPDNMQKFKEWHLNEYGYIPGEEEKPKGANNMFMRKVSVDIELYFIEALVLHRANVRHLESGGEIPFIAAISDYLHMLYDKIVESGGLENEDDNKHIASYDAFEKGWFCNYVDDDDGYILLLCDIYEDAVLKVLGYETLTDCPDYEEIETLYKSTLKEDTYIIDENDNCSLEPLDRALGKGLLKKINSEIKHFKKVMKKTDA